MDTTKGQNMTTTLTTKCGTFVYAVTYSRVLHTWLVTTHVDGNHIRTQSFTSGDDAHAWVTRLTTRLSIASSIADGTF